MHRDLEGNTMAEGITAQDPYFQTLSPPTTTIFTGHEGDKSGSHEYLSLSWCRSLVKLSAGSKTTHGNTHDSTLALLNVGVYDPVALKIRA